MNPSAARLVDGDTYYIKGQSSQKCLWIHNNEQMARLELMGCGSSLDKEHEIVRLKEVSENIYTIQWAHHNNYCLENASDGNEAPLQQNPCTGSENQRWELVQGQWLLQNQE